MNNYMLDTNIFNHILNDVISLDDLLEKGNFFVTDIQAKEILNTKDDNRRNKLLELFHLIPSNKIPTSSAVYGVSKYGGAKYGGSSALIKAQVDKKNGNKKNNVHDALIADTSIKNGFTLITHDSDLFSVTTINKGASSNLYNLLNRNSLDP